mgnify:CR=1 FL=1
MSAQGLYVGLMSGTSLDSVDASLVAIEGCTARLLATHSEAIEPGLRTRLLDLAESPSTTLEDVGVADRELGADVFGDPMRMWRDLLGDTARRRAGGGFFPFMGVD